ncbi:MAG: hypothetical protein FWH02_07065 [Oscillospiraceae bacterium]|nr:hypothetical protein [Oscillospiraceae bacterium]
MGGAFIAVCWNPITWIIDTIVTPLIDILVSMIMPILEWAVEFFLELILIAFADILFDLLVILLKLVSFFNSAFFAFSGVNNIVLRAADGVNYEQSNTFILQHIIQEANINRMYWQITLISAALCIIFTGISILRSINSTDYDPKKSVAKIWGRMGKTMITFLVIPSLMMFGIEISTMVAGRLVEDVFQSGATSVDNIIFLTTTMNAAKDDKLNGNNASFTDEVRIDYYEGSKKYDTMKPSSSIFSKSNREVTDFFHLHKIDFVTGYFLCIFMIFILFGAALFAVRRLLEILLLYVTAPLFVASIPLDEGKRFDAWRDMFVAKLVSCYGLLLMMGMYLSTAPMMVGGKLTLSDHGLTDALMKTLLLLGGALALKNGHSIALGILSPTAAQQAQTSVLGGFGMAFGVGAMMGGGISRGVSGLFGGGKGGGGKPAGGADGQRGGSGASESAAPGVQHKSAEEAQKFGG